jgi:hypothetical protein
VSLLGVFPASLSDSPTLSFGRCCEPNSLLVGAILVVLGRDPFVDIVCEHIIIEIK